VTQAIQLFDFQRLLGAGEQHFVTAEQGTFVLPGQVAGGGRPLVTNSNLVADSIVILADGTEVSGFILDGGEVPVGTPLHEGITGTNVVDIDINRNTIQHGVNGISLETTAGGATQGIIEDNTILLNSNAGILITADSGTTDLDIFNNAILGNGGEQIDVDLSGTAVADIDIQNNDIFAGGLIVGDSGFGFPENINISQFPGNQTESAIVINPINPNQLFAFANNDGGRSAVPGVGAGIFAARSTDGGRTWLPVFGNDFVIADGTDGLPVACCDPTVAWDEFGNLFVVYIDNTIAPQVNVLFSTDGGQSLQFLSSLGPANQAVNDQPTVAIGPGPGGLQGSVWVTYDDPTQGIVAQGALVTGTGSISSFSAIQPALGVGQFGDIAIGPLGQVAITGQDDDDIQVAVDIDGLGPAGFAPVPPVSATATNVELFDAIPAQPDRTVDAEAGLAYDRSGGVNNGRLYLVYTQEPVNESDNTEILVRFSNDNGLTWSAPVRVNDDSSGHSQFLPQIEVDQTTGLVAVSFHDSRNDFGLGAGDTNGIPNDNAQFFATVSRNGGLSFDDNIQVSLGTSHAPSAPDNPPGIARLDYGDYSGLTFHNGVFFPSWADNSNSTGDNPDGTLDAMDLYTARVTVLLQGAGADGIGINLAGTAALQNSVIANNSIDGMGGSGILVNSLGNSLVSNLSILNNTITDSGASGIELVAGGTSRHLDTLVDSNVVTDNGVHGILVQTADQSTITRTTITNSTFSRNLNSGVFLERLDDGLFGDAGLPNQRFTGVIVGNNLDDGNVITFNTVAGLNIQGSGNAPVQRSVVDFAGNTIFGNGTNVLINIQPNAEFLINGAPVP
jgi:hypothetical protein